MFNEQDLTAISSFEGTINQVLEMTDLEGRPIDPGSDINGHDQIDQFVGRLVTEGINEKHYVGWVFRQLGVGMEVDKESERVEYKQFLAGLDSFILSAPEDEFILQNDQLFHLGSALEMLRILDTERRHKARNSREEIRERNEVYYTHMGAMRTGLVDIFLNYASRQSMKKIEEGSSELTLPESILLEMYLYGSKNEIEQISGQFGQNMRFMSGLNALASKRMFENLIVFEEVEQGADEASTKKHEDRIRRKAIFYPSERQDTILHKVKRAYAYVTQSQDSMKVHAAQWLLNNLEAIMNRTFPTDMVDERFRDLIEVYRGMSLSGNELSNFFYRYKTALEGIVNQDG